MGVVVMIIMFMIVMMIVIVPMLVAVCMVVAMMVVIAMIMRQGNGVELLILFHGLRQFLAGDLLFRHLRLGENIIYDLLLEHRAAQLDQRIGIFAIVIDHFPFLAGKLPGPLHQCPLHLLVGYGHACLLADRTQKQAKPHPAVGNRLILRASLFLRRVFISKASA